MTIKVFKTKVRSYAIVAISSSSGRTDDIWYLTASKDKDLKEWEKTLEKLNKPKNFHSPPQWVSKEENKFWNDWLLIWEPDTWTPGETRYRLYINIHDPKVFLYVAWDLWGEYHTSPGRYYVSYQFLTAKDKITWLEGTWRNYEEKSAKISHLIKDIDIEKAIEEHLKAIEKAREERAKAKEEKEKTIKEKDEDKKEWYLYEEPLPEELP